MLARWTKGLLHLLVGGACAALVAWLVYGFAQTLTRTDGPVRAGMAALVVLSAALVGWLLLAPPVRPAEVALARTLLDVRLEDPADTTSWESRLRGLAWAVAVIVLGGASLLALLWCLPQGVALVVAAAAPEVRDRLAGVVGAWPPGALVVLGLGLLVLGTVGQAALVAALRRLAQPCLGPTSGDRLAVAEQQRRRLLRANHLARELHDSVGHALTAIGVQAEAGARVAGRDPQFARESLERIAETTRSAVAELDEVLAELRSGDAGMEGPGADGPGVPVPGTDGHGTGAEAEEHSLRRVVELLGDAGPLGRRLVRCEDAAGEVDAAAARTAYRVVQEAMTNARRHGSGDLRGGVEVADGQVRVLLENPVLPSGRASAGRGGRGLVGLHERLALVGGRLTAGRVEVGGERWWRLEARWPATTREESR